MNCAIISDVINVDDESKIRENLRKMIIEEYNNGSDNFYTNCERGIPLIAAEIICELKREHNIRLNIVVPYEEQAADWSEDLRNRYFYCHERSDSIIYSSRHFTSDCYDIAEKIMKEKCENLLILW